MPPITSKPISPRAHTSLQRGYFRYPTLHDDTVVFTAEGDLWKVSDKGGVAQRLTSHHGVEARAAISSAPPNP